MDIYPYSNVYIPLSVTVHREATMMEAAQLLDFGDYPEIHAAGIGECHLLPDGRMRNLMFDWFRIDGIWRRRVVGAVTRPTVNLFEDQWMMRQEARQGMPMHHVMPLQ